METWSKALQDNCVWCCKANYKKMGKHFKKIPISKPEPAPQIFKNVNFFCILLDKICMCWKLIKLLHIWKILVWEIIITKRRIVSSTSSINRVIIDTIENSKFIGLCLDGFLQENVMSIKTNFDSQHKSFWKENLQDFHWVGY